MHECPQPLPKYIHQQGRHGNDPTLKPGDGVEHVGDARRLEPERQERRGAVREEVAQHDGQDAHLDADVPVRVEQVHVRDRLRRHGGEDDQPVEQRGQRPVHDLVPGDVARVPAEEGEAEGADDDAGDEEHEAELGLVDVPIAAHAPFQDAVAQQVRVREGDDRAGEAQGVQVAETGRSEVEGRHREDLCEDGDDGQEPADKGAVCLGRMIS